MIERPDFLTGDAAACWDLIVAICRQERVRIDHVPWLVEILAVNWAGWREAARAGVNDANSQARQRLIFKCAADLGLSLKALKHLAEEPDSDEGDPDEAPPAPRVIRYRFDRFDQRKA